MRRVVPPLFVLCLGFAPAPVYREPPKATRGEFRGTWRQVSIEFEGTDQTAANEPHRLHWVVEADKITIFSKGKQNRGSWSYRLDASGTPATLDLTPSGGQTMPAILRVEGGRLTVLLQNFPKNGRPKDFGDRSKPGVGRHVMERVKSGEVE
jgi:uncharacterized protein (TIGR03067 family)